MSGLPPLSCEVVLWHPDGRRVLRRGGALPVLDVPRGADPAGVVLEVWGLPVWPLHDLGARFGLGGTVQFQARTGEAPGGMAWSPVLPEPVPGARPWQRPGWPARTLAWLDTELAACGQVRSGPPTFISMHDLNTVWEVPLATGPAFLKISEGGREAAVTAEVARTLPDLAPPLLGAWPEVGAQLVASGGQLLDGVPDLEAWTQALTRLADVQRRADPVALAAAGCSAWPLNRTGEAVLDLLGDAATLRGWGLPAAEVDALRGARPRVRALLRDLAAHGLPDRPAHGDAHPRNALRGARGSVWFDWSEAASAAHPFMDAGWFLAFALHPQRGGLPVRSLAGLDTALAGAFLGSWGCPDATPLLWRALPLALLHRAAAYDRQFRDWAGTVPGWRPLYTRFALRQAVGELSRLD
ncbi:phosphotransferase [Deinococcus gobiensis]|nr:phosphotransferase [Deinococcus gobiensis]